MAVLSKLTYRFNRIPAGFLQKFLLDSKIHMEMRRKQNSPKEKQSWNTNSDFKTYYKALIN